jgi:hypothetical protein
MKTICISSFKDLLELRSSYNQKYENQVLFRGTSNPLIPSLVEHCSYKTYQDLVYKEFELLSEFDAYSTITLKHKNDIPKDWEKRIAAREHGLASSLMDWSNNLEIATEFAIHDFEAKKIDFTSIWFLIKKDLKQVNLEESTDIHFNDIDEPTIINYSLGAKYFKQGYSRRKFIQGGFFLKQSYFSNLKPLDINSFFDDKLIQIIITKSIVPKIWKSLSQVISLDEDPIPMKSSLDDICHQINIKYA